MHRAIATNCNNMHRAISAHSNLSAHSLTPISPPNTKQSTFGAITISGPYRARRTEGIMARRYDFAVYTGISNTGYYTGNTRPENPIPGIIRLKSAEQVWYIRWYTVYDIQYTVCGGNTVTI